MGDRGQGQRDAERCRCGQSRPVLAANDGTGLSTPLQVTIAITDVDHLPTGVSIDNTSIAEGATAGDVVGTLMATDQDNDTLTYVITDAQGVAVTDSLFDVSVDATATGRSWSRPT